MPSRQPTFQRHRCGDRPLAAADRAVAAARVDDAVGQVEFDHHGAAVTREPLPWEDGDATCGCDRHGASARRTTVIAVDAASLAAA